MLSSESRSLADVSMPPLYRHLDQKIADFDADQDVEQKMESLWKMTMIKRVQWQCLQVEDSMGISNNEYAAADVVELHDVEV